MSDDLTALDAQCENLQRAGHGLDPYVGADVVRRLIADLRASQEARDHHLNFTRIVEARADAAESEVAHLRELLARTRTQVEVERDAAEAAIDRVRALPQAWLRNEDRSADYQDGLADAAEQLLHTLDGEATP